MEIIEYLQYPWLIRALVASVIVGITCGVLGVFIVLRNMALIGDALSHAILPGIVIAFLVFGGYHLSAFFAGAVIAGLIAAVSISWIQQNLPTKNDAAIGIIFTVMFALGVIGISILARSEGVHLDLKDFLFGNILGVSGDDLKLNWLILAAVVLSIFVYYRYFYLTTFQESYAKAMGFNTSIIHYYLMLLLSFTVVASLQTVGVILVVAMLVTPSSTAILWSDRLKIVILLAALFGSLAAVSGLAMAIVLEIPPGPSMAVTAFVFYMISALISPKKGFLSNIIKNRKYRKRILTEDILKVGVKQKGGLISSSIELAKELERSKKEVSKNIRYMRRRGWLEKKAGHQIRLTTTGKKRGLELVRAHRLWESWLVAKAGLNENQIHQDAELYEHLLNKDMINQIDASLGFPLRDPHGTPIPQIHHRTKVPIHSLKKEDWFIVHHRENWALEWERTQGKSIINRMLLVEDIGEDSISFKRLDSKRTFHLPIDHTMEVIKIEEKISENIPE